MGCPCGSGQDFEACCGPLIAGEAFAATAEAVMRARYTAHKLGKYAYLLESTHVASRGDVDWTDLERWSSSVEWVGLEVLDTEGGKEHDRQGRVSFLARFSYEGREQEHREHSFFERDANDHWVYVDGEVERQAPMRRETPKIGRNDVCPCGSGKKYKKCCGTA